MFDYSKIRFFSKDGYEIPSDIEKKIFFNVDSSLDGKSESRLYAISTLTEDGSISKNVSTLKSYDKGIIFKSTSGTFSPDNCKLYETLDPNNSILINRDLCELEEVQVYNDYIVSDVNNKAYGISSINLTSPIEVKGQVEFPSIKYKGFLNFKPISSELFETETIYILKEEIENGVKTFKKILSDDVENGRYKLLFLIDSSVAGDFRMFSVDEMSNNITFNNSQSLSFTNDDTTPYRINIAFNGKDEGIYEEKLYICIIDSLHDDEPYLLGTIILHGEAIGEDERYRTLFTDFGIPDPKKYLDVFKEAGIDEDLENKELLNEKSKELFLTYDKIFPYVGTYKALINAIAYLGYNDITFKEWYKNVSDKNEISKYVSYDVAYKNEFSKNKINTLSLEERLSIKKLNWLTMKYKLNDVVNFVDKDENIDVSPEIPYIIKAEYTYRNDELLLKLYALKQWLEKYIIAQNCRIIEIMGEGIYVERYAYNIYGNVTKNIEFDSDFTISPYLKGTSEDRILKDGSAYISIGIKEIDNRKFKNTIIGELNNIDFENLDKSEMYIDVESKTVKSISDGYDSSKALNGEHIIINNSFLHPTDFDYVSIKASNSSSEYMFRDPFTTNNLWIHVGEIQFDPKNYKDDVSSKEVFFNRLPEIYLESAYLRDPNAEWIDNSTSIIYSIERDIDPNNNISFIIKNWRTEEIVYSTDYPILKKKISNAYLKYTEYNYFALPMFLIKGFELHNIDSDIFDENQEYILDIHDGKFAFEDNNEDYYLYLNFNYDNSGAEQNIEVNTVFIEDKIEVNQTDFNDPTFVDRYLENPDTAFNYLDEYSIKVNKTGIYDIYVYCYDNYNNVYGKKVPGNPEVRLVAPEIELIAEQAISNNDDEFFYKNEDGILVENIEYENNPIFKPTYLINNIKIEDSSAYYNNISYAVDSPKKDDIVRFYNATDRFVITSFSSPYKVERTGSAKSNEFPKSNNNVKCILFDTTYDIPIECIDASLSYDGSIYKLAPKDSTFINYFKNVDNPPHLYIKNYNRYDASIITEENQSIIKIDTTNASFKSSDLYQIGQKIKLIVQSTKNNLEYSLGIYTISDITIEDQIVNLYINTIINTEFLTSLYKTSIKYYVTYPNETFMNYKINVNNIEERIDGYCEMHLDEYEMLDHLDNTYSIGYRDFDIENAYNDWIKENQFEILYKYDIPITLINDKIVCRAGKPKYDIKNPSYYWIVYKQNGSSRTKYYELYNDSIFLNIDEEGIYDVELWTYDEYGNLVGRNNKGSFKK